MSAFSHLEGDDIRTYVQHVILEEKMPTDFEEKIRRHVSSCKKCSSAVYTFMEVERRIINSLRNDSTEEEIRTMIRLKR